MPRRSFGKYEVLARLATGGAASIFLARQPGAAGFHKLVVLKTLLPERACDADFVAMFLDEARLAARLNHPNCVQIYDLGRVRGVYYISMEYIFGETLWNLLTTVTRLRTPLPPSHVAGIIASACDGLHHAHDLKDSDGRPYNLVHRDVSPQNIMITFEGQTKVVDFGIAKAETGRAPTMAGIVKGKFSYMSPEQITGGEVDRRSDIYSLGIVLFECLASRRLYRGDSPEEIAKLILEHRAPRLRDVVPDIPLGLDNICAKALSRHPSKRFASTSEMGDAIREHLDTVRHNQSTSATARLLKDRFDDIVSRRRAYEGALNGTYEESELLETLDARAVRDIDLFPDETEIKPDFQEAVEYLLDQSEGERSASVTVRPILGSEDSADQPPSPGFRVELDSQVENQPDPIEMLSDSTAAADDDNDVDPTRLEFDGVEVVDFEDKTQFDPDNTEQLESNTKSEAVVTAPAPASEATSVDYQSEPIAQEGDWDDATSETDFETAEPVVEPVTTPRAPSYGGAAAAFDDGMASIVETDDRDFDEPAELPSEAIVFGIDPPPVEPADTAIGEAYVPSVSASNRPPARNREPSAVRVQAADPNVTRSPIITASASPPSRAASALAPSTDIARAGTYSLSAIFAALGFGLSMGIVIGMLIARMIFAGAEAPPTQIPPVIQKTP